MKNGQCPTENGQSLPATHLVERGIDLRTNQSLLRHESLETTMIYTHVMQKAAARVRSPLDA